MDLALLKQELTFKTARSSGPGGQNVNKVETKVELRFDVQNSRFLDEAEKLMVMQNLAKCINDEGILLLTNQTTRSQLDNKEAAIADFEKLMVQATTPPKKRKKVKPLTADREKRLSNKKLDSEKKSLRKKISFRLERDFFLTTTEGSECSFLIQKSSAFQRKGAKSQSRKASLIIALRLCDLAPLR